MDTNPEEELAPSGNSQATEVLLEILAQVGNINKRLTYIENKLTEFERTLPTRYDLGTFQQVIREDIRNIIYHRYGD